jgi:hypothetical protein
MLRKIIFGRSPRLAAKSRGGTSLDALKSMFQDVVVDVKQPTCLECLLSLWVLLLVVGHVLLIMSISCMSSGCKSGSSYCSSRCES